MRNRVKPNAAVTDQQMAAADRINLCMAMGIVGLLFGGYFIAAFWPSVEPVNPACFTSDLINCTPETSGDSSLVAFGFLVAGMAQVSLLIGVIGHGTALGVARAGQPSHV
ncbi:hypothetical protein [Nocardioides sp. Leaf374]|uniref:hypothetical protein n=1 Tax=Nocardioides sp. Leaf374 TaxID=2876560 RepID=UPI001E2EC693|nr:hypothetical protein [Nocardioides sp. Leaf374]